MTPQTPTREGDAMTSDNPDNHYPDYISDNPERDVTSVAVEVGGVVHLEHYSTRNGMIRVTYRSSCKSTQLGGMENAPWVLARIMLAEQAREAFGLVEDFDVCVSRFIDPACSPEASAHGFHDVNKSLEDVHAFGSRSHLSSIQAAIASSPLD